MMEEKKTEVITIEGSPLLMAKYILLGINNLLYIRGVVDSDEFERVSRYGLKTFVLKSKREEYYFDYQRRQLEKFLVDESVDEVCLLVTNEETRQIGEEWHFKLNYASGRSKVIEIASGEDEWSGRTANEQLIIQDEIRELFRQILGSPQKELAFKLDEIMNFIQKKEVKSVQLRLINSKTNEDLEEWEFDIMYEDEKSKDVGTKDTKTIQKEISAVLRSVTGTACSLPLLDDADDITFIITVRAMPGIPIWEGWKIVPDSDIKNKQDIQLRSLSTSIHNVETKVTFKSAP